MASNYCPKCGSHDVEFEGDGIVECLNCGFRGINFPSEHLLIDDVDDEEESPIKKPVVKKTAKKEVKKTKSKASKPAKKTTKSKLKKGKKK